MAAKKKTSAFIDSLVPITEEKEEFKLSPVPDSLRQIRPTPSTTSPRKPKQDFKLDPGFIPAGEVRPFTDDELFRKIEGNLEYSPTDAELDKYLNYKEQNPTGAVDFIKGAWDGAWGVLGEIGSGAKAIASEPLKSLDFFTAEGWERKAANISEGVARATWDLGTLGREFNEMFGRLRDDELREEMKEMKLRQSNPDYRMKGAMGGEAYLSPEQREQLRKTFAVDYIKERISDDLDDIEVTTDNFQKPVDQLKREFARRGLTYVEDATKRDYTTANYIDNILDDKQRKKLVDDFPNWMRGRQRDRWRRTRYMQKISERARRGDQTIIGEFFGPEFDEKFRKVVNPQVATLLSYAGGPPEVAGALATRIPRKGLTAGAALTDPIQTAPTLGGKATELAGKALRKGGEKVEQLGDYIVETPQRAAGVGALLGAAAARDLSAAPAGALAGAVEQRVGVISSAGRALQSAGETAQAIGEVVGRPGGTEGILKAASRVAPTEETAKKLNTISFLDPAINLASDLGKGAATGSFVGLALAAPSEDAGVMGAGFGGGLTGGFVGSGAGRFLTKGALLRNQQQNDWEQFRQRLSPKQIESIKKYAPDINTMGQVMSQVRMLEGVLTPESRGNVDFDFISPQEFINRFGAARGVVVIGNRVKPEIIINTGWRGPNSLFHEAWHAMKRFAGNTEQMKVRNEKGKLEQKDYPALQPYLRKIQTILFGEELGGQQVVKGLYDKETILKDFADQYTDKMTDDQKAKWEDSFKQDPVTKEKFTPEQAEQNKLNYLMEELEAESFRYLMSGSDPRGIASGQRSITQKFVDHMLLAEHSKTLRGMKKALSSVGIRFKGSGEPSDIFAEKDSKGRWKGLTNSPELNAALRDYVRAWEGLQYRTRYINDVEPSGFQIGGQGVTGSRVVEFQLRKPENNFLREHFKSSDIIKKDDKGEPVLMPDGVTLQLLSEGQIRKLQEDRAELVKKALEDTEDPNGMTSEVNEKGEVSFKGVPTPRQLDAIDTIPSNILTPNQKQIIREVSTMMSDDPGAPLQFLYNAAIGRGKRYSSSLSSSHRIAVPLGFHVSKAQNFYFTSLDLGAYQNKLKAWADDTKKALHKGGHKLALWDKDVKAFEVDLFKYLDNHKNGRPGETGLAPDQKTAEQKRNVLNDFFNINKGEDTQGNFNPIAAARRAVDPKTGKQKKRAYRNLENLIRSYRLDRVLDEDFGKSLSYSLGKPLPMKSQADFYRKQLENFMALPNQQQGARFMPAPAEADYSAAVKQGDLAKAQELVNQAADAAGYDSPQLYHGSIEKELRKLDPKKAVEVEGGVFLSTNEDVAYDYTFERAYGDIISEEPLGDIVRARVKFNNPLEYKPKGKIVDAIEMGRAIKTAKEQGNDGLIIRDIDDTVQGSGDMGDVYVAFSPEQIKSNDPITRDNRGEIIPLSKRFDSQTEDIRFMPAPAEGENMVAVHNLTADNLRHSLKMGGIANPSMAILDVNKGNFEGYGDITLVASKELIDPKKGAKVFGADIYSPRYPDITTEIPSGTSSKIRKYLDQLPYKDITGSDFDFSGLSYSVEDRGWSRAAEEHNGLQAAYLQEKGILPDLDAAAAQEKDPYFKKVAARRVVEDIIRKPEHSENFRNWVNELPEREGWDFKEKIFKGYTNLGNRRYTPHTLDNVVKIMKRNIRGGESFNYGAGSVRAKAAPQFRSVAQIKKNRGKLTDPESMEKVKEEANSEMIELESELDPYLKQGMKSDNPFSDIFSYRLQEAAEIGVRSLRDYYEDGAPFEKVSSFLNKLKDLPSDYFEAKFPRAVQLEEFEAAIIPEDLDPKLKKVLEDRGLELREYSNKSGEFYRDDETPRREALQKQTEEAGLRFMPQPTFYSKAERAVEGAKAGIFNKEGMTSVGQAKALLQKNSPETELEWSGVLDYLDLQKEEGNKVSKQDLLSYLKNNGVEVEEVLRGPKEMPIQDQAQALKEKPDTISVQEGIERIGEGKRVHVEKVNEPHKGHLIELFDLVSLEDSDSVYLQDIEKGEFRLRKGGVDTGGMLEMKPMPSGMRGVFTPTYFSPTEQFAGGPAALPGGENYRELVLKLPDGSLKGGETEYFEVPSGHRFPEDNILAHVRFTERTDADGKRMLFLDEVQSDWNTDIRERGVKKKRPTSIFRAIEILQNQKYDKMKENLPPGELSKFYDNKEVASFLKAPDESLTPEGRALREEMQKVDTSEIDQRINLLREEFPNNESGAPDMPYKGSKWQDLVMKRMIRWAADNGYDRLGWITGKDTADRYDLSKAVDKISYYPQNKRLIAQRGERGTPEYSNVVDEINVSPEKLESYVGKDLAKKLLSTELQEPDGVPEGRAVRSYDPADHLVHTLRGEDLRVGGEWASNLYDKSLPKIARKLTKKKGAVGRVGIYGSNGKLNGALAKNGIKPKYEANYVDISPEVKELAQEGFSYFMPEGRGGAASAPVQTAAPQPPSGVIIPKVKLTEDEKEESRKLLQQLLD